MLLVLRRRRAEDNDDAKEEENRGGHWRQGLGGWMRSLVRKEEGGVQCWHSRRRMEYVAGAKEKHRV